MNRFQKLSTAATAATVLLVTLGAVVRSSGSGLGCPDWPRCFGSWIPPLRATALIEYSHRLTASALGALVLALAISAWLRYRSHRMVFWPSFLALVVLILQGWIGRRVVLGELPRGLVALHFSTAMTLVGLLVLVTAGSFQPRGGRLTRTAVESFAMAGLVFGAVMVGAFVAQMGAALVFSDWPLMGGRLIPRLLGPAETLHFAHRALALLAGAAIAYVAVRVARQDPRDPALVRLARGALALWAAQVIVGAANVFASSAPWAIVLHVLLGTLLWAAAVATGVLAYRRAPEASAEREEHVPRPSRRGALATLRAYVLLTKPRIIELLLITTVPAMIVAAGGWPPLWLIAATLIGGSLTAGAANAVNCYLDRDIDEMMARTSGRPLPAGEVEPRNALRFGVALGVAGFVWLVAFVNLTSALLALGAILFYVFVYTLWLKRTTPSNIVIGGAAGAVPVLVGWAAVTSRVDLPALVMFAIVFYWTPPHFWALALRYSSDYAAARVPMLPVVRGATETTRQIVLYSLVLLAVSLLLHPVGRMGTLYLLAAAALGSGFVIYALRLRRNPDHARAMSLFRYSITYLTLLFAAMALDRLIPTPHVEGLSRAAFTIAGPLFFAAQAAILLTVARPRDGARVSGRRGDTVAAELVWTAIPTLAVALLFIASGQTLP